MNLFHVIKQRYKRKIAFTKRQAVAVLIILKEKTNENFGMEMDNTLGKRIKNKKNGWFNLK